MLTSTIDIMLTTIYEMLRSISITTTSKSTFSTECTTIVVFLSFFIRILHFKISKWLCWLLCHAFSWIIIFTIRLPRRNRFTHELNRRCHCFMWAILPRHWRYQIWWLRKHRVCKWLRCILKWRIRRIHRESWRWYWWWRLHGWW